MYIENDLIRIDDINMTERKKSVIILIKFPREIYVTHICCI